MQIIDGIPVFGDPVDQGALEQIKNAQRYATRVALMADHHLGFGVPIGGVVAYPEHVSPSGVGYDIACGNKAVLTDANSIKVKTRIHSYMDEVFKKISFGVGRVNEEQVEHELFDDPAWSEIPVLKKSKDKAVAQLGTVGSGNHYVDIFLDEKDRVWVGVHFGSRGLGHAVATEYIDIAKSKGYFEDGIAVLHHRSDAGEEYVKAMEIAGRYAYAGRDWVCKKVAKIIGGDIMSEVHNHHNFAWRENHGGEDFWVVRKGATPAFPGQRGFVGGSMGENAVIVEGVQSEMAEHTLHSTVHGAGRVMSRRRALGDKKKGIQGEISERAMQKWLQEAGVVLRGGGLDEAPQAYKRLPEVLAHHGDSIRVVHTLKPIGVAMAGPDVRDPYKD
ncbi:MAG: RtcB family protein [Armatimonadetes bacterium]|nr:RtcB family protein [Armatimonadota bacterium]